MQPIPLHTILFSFLKYTQKHTEKILSNTNQQNYGTKDAKKLISEHFPNNY